MLPGSNFFGMEMAEVLFDAHCHLQDERLPANSLDELLQEAASSGVQQLACNGCWQEDWGHVAALAARHPADIVPNFGLHPWWVGRRSTDWLEQLRRMLEEYPHAGLGECGLDKGPRGLQAAAWELQVEAFEQQLRLAQELSRPVSVHCVRAYGPLHDALRRLDITVPVVLHSWAGSADMTAALVQQLPNVYFSLSGHLARLAPHKALPMVGRIPLERLLLESDSPDGALQLSPAWQQALPALAGLPERIAGVGLSGGINRPCVLPFTLQLVAAAVGRGEQEVAAATRENAQRVFCGISSSSSGGGGGNAQRGDGGGGRGSGSGAPAGDTPGGEGQQESSGGSAQHGDGGGLTAW